MENSKQNDKSTNKRFKKLDFDFWQRFSKALLVVVAVMPAAGILISVARLLGPGFIDVIAGEEVTPDWLAQISSIFESIGWAIIGNLGFLFAIAIGGTWSDEKAGGAFAAALAYLIFHTILWPITDLLWGMTGIVDMSQFQDTTLGITTLKGSQVFSGILLGFVGAKTYDKYKTFDKLPNFLSFFNGKRFVPIAVIGVTIVWAWIFSFVWIWIEVAILAIGEGLTTGGYVWGPFFYGTLERLLLPFGLHHMITIPMNYTDLGGVYYSINNLYSGVEAMTAGQDPLWLAWVGDVGLVENVLGISNWQDASYAEFEQAWNDASLSVSFSEMENRAIQEGTTLESMWYGFQEVEPARYKTGQVFISTAILPAAALAMWLSLTKANRKKYFSMYLSAAIAVFVCGITEPIEFMFAFTSPVLYLVYALVSGLAFASTDIVLLASDGDVSVSVHAFGMIEFIARSPMMLTTSLWVDWVMFVAMSIMWFGLAFAIFYYYIKFFGAKVPGRMADDLDPKLQATNTSTKAKDENAKIDKGSNTKKSDKSEQRLDNIIEALGGEENMIKIDACMTRLRVTLKDVSKLNKQLMKEQGAMDVVVVKNSTQSIFGGESDVLKEKIKEKLKR